MKKPIKVLILVRPVIGKCLYRIDSFVSIKKVNLPRLARLDKSDLTLNLIAAMVILEQSLFQSSGCCCRQTEAVSSLYLAAVRSKWHTMALSKKEKQG